MKFGGYLQNPAFILLNLLGPENYEGFPITTYLSGGIILFTLMLSGASVLKLLSMQTIYAAETFGQITLDLLLMLQMKILFLVWLPEFIYYVVPALGTSAYFMTIDI